MSHKEGFFKEINWRTAFLLQNFKDKKALSKPVLADTQSVFPNKALLCLPLKKEAWLSDIHSCWNRLDKPSLRVFIPLGYNEEKLQKYWPQSDVFHNLSYYREMKR